MRGLTSIFYIPKEIMLTLSLGEIYIKMFGWISRVIHLPSSNRVVYFPIEIFMLSFEVPDDTTTRYSNASSIFNPQIIQEHMSSGLASFEIGIVLRTYCIFYFLFWVEYE